jgi:multidrug efflux pump subunit AcrA (membrane-fusion protein)
MYAEVDLETERHQNVLSVPMEAIDGSGGDTRVFAVRPSGSIEIVPVRLGIENAHRVEIRSAEIAAGDRVVVGSRAGLKQGDKVQAKAVALAGDPSPKD